MTIAPLPRRTPLQSGAALAAPLALAGVWRRSSRAAPVAAEAAELPVSGTLAAWVVVEPDRGATIRLVQLDAASQPVWQVAAADLTLADPGASLQQVSQRANEMAVKAVAWSWGVPAAECNAGPGRIAHAAGQHLVGYVRWLDLA